MAVSSIVRTSSPSVVAMISGIESGAFSPERVICAIVLQGYNIGIARSREYFF